MADLQPKSFFKKNWKLLVGAALLLLFAILVALLKTVDVAPNGENGTIGLSTVNFAVRDAVGEHYRLYDLTQYLGYFAILLAAGFAVWAGVRVLYFRFSFRKAGICGCTLTANVLLRILYRRI